VLLFVALGAVLVGFVFGPRLGGEYVWDDIYLVQENPDMRSAGGLRQILTTHLWHGANQQPSQLYHPVPMATLWLQVQLTGFRLWPLRLVNVLVHLGCGVLLLLLLRRERLPGRVPLVAAAAFLVHPSVTEPVMWLTGRHDTLAVLAGLAALLLWPMGPGRGVAARAAGSALLCGVAVLCKEPYVVLPILLLLGDARRGREAQPPRLGPRLGLWALPVAVVLAVFGLRHALGISAATDTLHASARTHLVSFATIAWRYLGQLGTLSNGPTTAVYRPVGLAPALAILTLLGAAMAGAAGWWRRGSRAGGGVLFGLAWFLLSLAPHVLTIPLIGQYGNRYGYFPLCGLIIAAAHLAAAAEARLGGRLRTIALGAAAAAVAALALRTAAEARPWSDDRSLWGADLERDPRNGIALTHFGYAVSRREGCATALPYFARATELAPGYGRAWHNVAGCLVTLGRHGAALAPARRALELQPGSSRSEYNLGAALLLSGQREEGLRHLRACLRLEAGYAPATALLAAAQSAADPAP
jgi:hypothetical protein